ncbi:MAG TPA: RHS repeat-associated core domain-containing protein [Chitinophagaceae bacterium]|nr:RHS repeat-associated core domain-containing protein [Chitinophagaceae bacterium]
MKFKHALLMISLLLLFAATFGQTKNIIDRVIRKDSGLLIFTQKDWKSFTIAAAVDKRTHVSYLISCFGQIVDSVHIADEDYKLIESKKATPFEHYNAICDKILSLSETAKQQFRKTGKLNSKWQYASLITEYVPELKTSPGRLQKIIFLDRLSEYYLLHKWLVNNPNPGDFIEDSATVYLKQDRAKAGTMIIKGDTTFYYNQNNIAWIYKAILLSKEAKIFYYDRDNNIADSLLLNPKRTPALAQQKADVFLLYRGWLEMQKQSVENGIRILDSTNRKYPNTTIQFADNHTTNINELIFETRQSLSEIINNINLASNPHPKAIATILHQQYENSEVNKVLLSSLGVGYKETITTGDRLYELTDHRGNVMAVVSDKKIGVDANNDGIVDYYVADVVSAQDYYPFGQLQPGRQYGTKGRYLFNGKEQDPEVKGEGTQYDYGFRIYDPRLGRFLSVDPLTKTYPWYTPYQFAGNKPIWAIDLDGLEENTLSTYVYKNPPLSIKPTFQGVINITDARTQTAHKTFSGNFSQLRKSDATGLSTSLVNQLTGSNVGNGSSSLDITITGTRSQVFKTWKGTDIKYFTQYSYSFTSNNVTEAGTFELQTGQIQASARAWDPLTFLLLNKVVSSVVITAAEAGGTTATQEIVTLYRSISKAEAESIQYTKQLSFAEGQMEVKQFWQSTEGLEAWNKSRLAGEYNLEITVPKSLLGKGKPLNTITQVDEFYGPTATIDNAAQLNIVNQSIQSIKITPIKTP